MAKKSGGEIAAAPTERELVQQRVAEAGEVVNQFVTAIFDGVRGKVDDMKADLEAALAAARIRDARARLDEIHTEVKRLADEAVAAEGDVAFNLLVTEIAVLRGSFAQRYTAAVAVVPGANDPAAIQKAVKTVFDAVIADIKERRKNRPLAVAPGRLDTLDLGTTGVRVVETPPALPAAEAEPAAAGSTEPPADSSAAAQEPSSDTVPEPEQEPHQEVIAEATPETDVVPETPAETDAEAASLFQAAETDEGLPAVIPQVGLPPGSGRKQKGGSRNGSRNFAQT